MSKPTAFGPVDYAAALGVVVLWGLNFVAMKYALRDFTPFQLGAARYVVAALPLVFIVQRPQLAWKWLLLYGLCQGVGQFGFLFSALRVGMTASLASVLMQTQVFFTVVFSFLMLHERPGRTLLMGLGLAAAALACFGLSLTSAGTGGVTLAGLLLNLCAAAMWAVSNIVARRAQQSASTGPQGYDPVGFVVWSSLVPILPFMAMSWLVDAPAEQGRWLAASASGWLAVAYLGWLATVAAYALWTGLLKRHTANQVAPFSLGVPVVGLAAGMLALQENITHWQWAGIALVMAALACILLPRPR